MLTMTFWGAKGLSVGKKRESCFNPWHIREAYGLGNAQNCFIDKVVFIWVSKVTRNCFGFPLLRSVIGLKNSRHLLNQSNTKPKPIATWSHAFFPRLASVTYLLRVLIGSLCCVRLLWLAIAIALVLVFLDWKPLYQKPSQFGSRNNVPINSICGFQSNYVLWLKQCKINKIEKLKLSRIFMYIFHIWNLIYYPLTSLTCFFRFSVYNWWHSFRFYNVTEVPSSLSVDASDAEIIGLLRLEVWDLVWRHTGWEMRRLAPLIIGVCSKSVPDFHLLRIASIVPRPPFDHGRCIVKVNASYCRFAGSGWRKY